MFKILFLSFLLPLYLFGGNLHNSFFLKYTASNEKAFQKDAVFHNLSLSAPLIFNQYESNIVLGTYYKFSNQSDFDSRTFGFFIESLPIYNFSIEAGGGTGNISFNSSPNVDVFESFIGLNFNLPISPILYLDMGTKYINKDYDSSYLYGENFERGFIGFLGLFFYF